MKFRTRYDESLKCAVNLSKVDSEAACVQKQFAEDCDINKIMQRYSKTGQLPKMIRTDGRYGDFTEVGSYQESLNTVLFAQEQFNALPAKVRSRFENNPERFLEFVHNPDNEAEMRSLGLLKEKVVSGTANEKEGPTEAKKEQPTAVLEAKKESARPVTT